MDYSPIFKDSSIAEAIRKMGGWKQLCKMELNPLVGKSEEPWRRKDFVDYYLVAKRQGKDFLPLIRGVYKDYVYVGYDKTDNLPKLLEAVLSREEQGGKVLPGIREKVIEKLTPIFNQLKRG